MKVAASQIEGHLRRIDPKAAIYLLYGPDQGLAGERAKRLMVQVVNDPQDPFLVCDLQASELRSDPGRLIEEAQALSMIGGRRVVRIRGAGDFLTNILKPLLELGDIEALVIIEAGDLAASSSLRKAVEKAKNAAALPCYRDEGRGVQNLLAEMLREAGMTMTPDARNMLINSLGIDREVSRREIEKLILIHQDRPEQQIHIDDVAHAVGDSAALAIDDWVFAVLLGDQTRATALLQRLSSEGQPAVRLLRALLTILRRLMALKSMAGEPANIVSQAKPPVHFRQKPRFEAVLRQYSKKRLADNVAIACQCEAACKHTGKPVELLLARACSVMGPQGNSPN